MPKEQPKPSKKSEDLVKSSKKAKIELSEAELSKVAGGLKWNDPDHK